MIIDYKTGKIAYHCLLWREDGGLDFVQYDFEGKELFRKTERNPSPLVDCCGNA